VSESQDELIGRIERAESALRRLAIQKGDLGLFAMDLTMQQLKVLLVLAASGSRTSHDLAQALGVGATTLTGIVDRLEARDLVVRRPDTRDRRVRLVALSEQGESLVRDAHDLHREHARRLLSRLEPRLLVNLAEVMEAMAALIDDDFDCPTTNPARPE
jgi:DNA-binding MarR family transcriptional regulator